MGTQRADVSEAPLDGVLVVDVGGTGLKKNDLRGYFLRRLRVNPGEWFEVGVWDGKGEAAVAESIRDAPAGVVLLGEGWALSPPRMAALHKQIRSLAKRETPVYFLVVNVGSDGKLAEVKAEEKTVWNDFADSLADEKRLLEPLLAGAGVLYVVDPGKPLRDDFLAEMEILRWTGRPRLALLNVREDVDHAREELWREKLGSAFNLVRTFDAHRAKFDQRLLLMKALLEIEERHRDKLEETIRLIGMEWDERRDEAAEVIREFLAEALELRVSAKLADKDERMPSRRKRMEDALKAEYFGRLKKLEKACFSKLLGIYRHHLLMLESGEEAFEDIDLESEEVWKKWGLSRGQLTMVAAATGAAGGVAIDAATGFFSHGIFTAVGGFGSGAAAFFKGGLLPDLKVDMREGVKFSTGETKELAMGPPGNINFPWILLDGVLVRYGHILERAHGRRDVEVLAGPGGSGFTKDFPSERRKLLGKWFAECAKGKRPVGKDADSEVLWALEESLKDEGR
jgi:hypothetical protein